MSKARDRRKARQKREKMAQRANRTVKQIVPEGQFELPKVDVPGGRWLILVPIAVIVLFGVINLLGRINPNAIDVPPNAIWLDASWAYGERDDDEIAAYARQLQAHDIGHVYLYVSSLKQDNTWSGDTDGNNRFTAVEPDIRAFVNRLRAVNPVVQIYAWIEVNASTPVYRLDNLQVQNTVASFAERMVNTNNFDGVLLDVKPIFAENDDFPALIQEVRRQIGLDMMLIVAVPADLTPLASELNQPPVIAPGTEWSTAYKQRVALQADQLLITAYNSYRDDPVDYIEWVTYQVDAFVAAVTALDTSTTIMVSIPNYESAIVNGQPLAHDPQIENLSSALDGARRGVMVLDEETRPAVQGVAIFSDETLTTSDWRIFRDKWLD